MNETEWNLSLERAAKRAKDVSPNVSKMALFSFLLPLIGVTISIVIYIIAIFSKGFFCLLFSFIIFLLGISGIFSIIFGFLGIRQIKGNPENYRGIVFAIIGIILGSLLIIFTLFSAFILGTIAEKREHYDDMIILGLRYIEYIIIQL